MFTLYYKLKASSLDGGAIMLLTEIKESGGDGISIAVSGSEAAALIIGSKTYKIKDGAASIPADGIQDGIICPKFVTGTVLCPATPFSKRGNTITWAPISWEYAPEAYNAFLRLEELMISYRDELLMIKEAVQGKRLFSFSEETEI